MCLRQSLLLYKITTSYGPVIYQTHQFIIVKNINRSKITVLLRTNSCNWTSYTDLSVIVLFNKNLALVVSRIIFIVRENGSERERIRALLKPTKLRRDYLNLMTHRFHHLHHLRHLHAVSSVSTSRTRRPPGRWQRTALCRFVAIEVVQPRWTRRGCLHENWFLLV